VTLSQSGNVLYTHTNVSSESVFLMTRRVFAESVFLLRQFFAESAFAASDRQFIDVDIDRGG